MAICNKSIAGLFNTWDEKLPMGEIINVIGEPNTVFPTRTHKTPMLSLGNIYSFAELLTDMKHLNNIRNKIHALEYSRPKFFQVE